MGWLEAWLDRPIAIITWAVALLLMGVWVASTLPLEWIPKVELPEVSIQTVWQGNSPRAVERYVTAPIERALLRVPGTLNVESLSEEGRSLIRLQVSTEVDLNLYMVELYEQVTFLRGVLPDRVVPRIEKEVPAALREQTGFITLQVIGSLSPASLRRLAEERVAPKLRSLPGVAGIDIIGGEQQEVRISLDPIRLQTFNIQPDFIIQRLHEANVAEAYGRLHTQGKAIALLSTEIDRVEDVQKLVVASREIRQNLVRLQDVADVQIVPSELYSISRIDGQPVVTLSIDRAPGTNMLSLARSILTSVEDINAALPSSVRVMVATNQAEVVSDQFRDLIWQGGLSLVCVIVVLLCMLRNTSAVAISIFCVAIALAITMICTSLLGLSLNIITLAGLVLVFGLLVDNVVIVVEEYIFQGSRMHLSIGRYKKPELEIARRTLQAVWLPLIGGTLSTITVLIPIVYMSGELRVLFLPFSVLVSMTLVFSAITAGLLVTILGRFLPTYRVEKTTASWLTQFTVGSYKVAGLYPRATLVGLLLIIGIPVWTMPDNIYIQRDRWSEPSIRLAELYNKALGSENMLDLKYLINVALGGITRPFFQQFASEEYLDEGNSTDLLTRITFPSGSSIEDIDSLISQYERTALASNSVHKTLLRIQNQSAFLHIRFTEESLKTSEPFEIRSKLIQIANQMAGVQIGIWGLSEDTYSRGTRQSITLGNTIEAHGPNYDDLDDVVGEFSKRLLKNERVVEVNTNVSNLGLAEDREVLHIDWDAEASIRGGATTQDVANLLQTIIHNPQRTISYLNLENGSRLPIRLVMKNSKDMDYDRLLGRPLYVGDNTQMRLQDLASFHVERVPRGIERYNQQYKRYLTLDYRGPSRSERAMVQKALKQVTFPPGYHLQHVNYAFLTEEIKYLLAVALLATIGLVYLVLASIFESWRLPFVVLLSVPVALIGVAAGFLLVNVTFSEGAFIGSILLVGISVNDSILLVDRYRRLSKQRPNGVSKLLILLALRERLRPMWATTLSSVATMLPLLIFSSNSSFWMSLAVTIVSGLLASTLLAPLASVAILSRYPMKQS